MVHGGMQHSRKMITQAQVKKTSIENKILCNIYVMLEIMHIVQDNIVFSFKKNLESRKAVCSE